MSDADRAVLLQHKERAIGLLRRLSMGPETLLSDHLFNVLGIIEYRLHLDGPMPDRVRLQMEYGAVALDTIEREMNRRTT